MGTLINVIAVVFMIGVVVVLFRGLLNMMQGGSGEKSNKLMQTRILLQFVALVFLLLGLYLASR